jgi:tripartite-type tricarboxylate transporter receptor subunit TctC
MSRLWSRTGTLGIVALALVAMLLAACGGDDATPTPVPSDAEPTATPVPGEFYEGKTIRVVIPYSAGGSSSVLVPYFAHQLPNFIPGNPRMISSHITPIIAGYNFLAEADTDGTQIMYTSRAPLSQQYTEEATFDVGAFEYIIGYTSGESTLMINGDVPFDDLQDALASGHTLRLPIETDPTEMGGSDIAVIVTAEMFGYDLKLIPLSVASTGTAESLVAMERGDVDGQVAGAIWYTMPSLRPGWTEDGTIKPVAFFGRPGQTMDPNSEGPAVALNYTDIILAQANDELKALYNALVVPEVALGKHFLMPPGTDSEAVAIMRQAFSDAMADATFVKGLNRLLGINSINFSGAELQTTMEAAVAAFANDRENRDQKVLDLYNKYTQ